MPFQSHQTAPLSTGFGELSHSIVRHRRDLHTPVVSQSSSIHCVFPYILTYLRESSHFHRRTKLLPVPWKVLSFRLLSDLKTRTNLLGALDLLVRHAHVSLLLQPHSPLPPVRLLFYAASAPAFSILRFLSPPASALEFSSRRIQQIRYPPQ